MDIEVQSLLKGKRNALPEIPAENKQDMTDLHSFHSPSVMFCLVIKILDIFYNVIICPNFSFVIYWKMSKDGFTGQNKLTIVNLHY